MYMKRMQTKSKDDSVVVLSDSESENYPERRSKRIRLLDGSKPRNNRSHTSNSQSPSGSCHVGSSKKKSQGLRGRKVDTGTKHVPGTALPSSSLSSPPRSRSSSISDSDSLLSLEDVTACFSPSPPSAHSSSAPAVGSGTAGLLSSTYNNSDGLVGTILNDLSRVVMSDSETSMGEDEDNNDEDLGEVSTPPRGGGSAFRKNKSDLGGHSVHSVKTLVVTPEAATVSKALSTVLNSTIDLSESSMETVLPEIINLDEDSLNASNLDVPVGDTVASDDDDIEVVAVRIAGPKRTNNNKPSGSMSFFGHKNESNGGVNPFSIPETRLSYGELKQRIERAKSHQVKNSAKKLKLQRSKKNVNTRSEPWRAADPGNQGAVNATSKTTRGGERRFNRGGVQQFMNPNNQPVDRGDMVQSQNPANPFYAIPNFTKPQWNVNQFHPTRTRRNAPSKPAATSSGALNSNMYITPGVNPSIQTSGSLRPIIIDGSNVAMAHGGHGKFSCRGIKICAEFFKARGHTNITAFVPQFRMKSSESIDPHILDELEKEGIVKFTASRDVGRRRIASYDDRYIVQLATITGGIIVSNDNYKDLYQEDVSFRQAISERVLQFTWITSDFIMFPPDPLGRFGPKLDQFLLF